MTKPSLGLNRREFIATGISSGFALATWPITSFATSTSGEGLVTSFVEISTTDGKMPGYMATPKKPGKYPVILVIQEIFGIHEYIQDVCRRLAKQGYVAVAPYLYFRHGDVTKMPSIDDILKKVVSQVSASKVLTDLDQTVEWLKNVPAADPSKLGITGFCWGGGITWMYCAHNPKVKAGVAWYGRLTGTPSPMQDRFPLQIAKELRVPVLGLYGAKDKGIPVEDVEKMKAALKSVNSNSEIILYPEAEHGFHADYRPSFHEQSAKDGWDRLSKWFAKNGLK